MSDGRVKVNEEHLVKIRESMVKFFNDYSRLLQSLADNIAKCGLSWKDEDFNQLSASISKFTSEFQSYRESGYAIIEKLDKITEVLKQRSQLSSVLH